MNKKIQQTRASFESASPFRRCSRLFRRRRSPYTQRFDRRAWLAALTLLMAQGLSVTAPQSLAQSEFHELAQEQMDTGININTASAVELAAVLSGVGASRAEAIVRYREQFGPFESVEELSEVSGIGPSTVERNRSSIRIE